MRLGILYLVQSTSSHMHVIPDNIMSNAQVYNEMDENVPDRFWRLVHCLFAHEDHLLHMSAEHVGARSPLRCTCADR